ncbi:hypothetical protein COS16_07895 [Candidatus Desantisbacteria bacterium CG02_land_8_20_14_3_00_49_13]|nr:MAG: hypothetical protein COS16_07895 [Candidatus Desantisbacteria bacterium CG02_land_8_20_14_3_00_49_13]PJB27557.1 MAG: hypothetical protein CO111_04710 [Candidatus Desantisbacteria bacterium CG_4_9_14_3_um_filter_50_7]
MRLELRWRKEKDKADLEKVLKKYIDSLKEGVKRKKLSFSEIKPRDIFADIHLRNKEKRIFSWRSGNREVLNLVAQCNECHNIIMAQVSVTEKDAEKIPEIFAGLEDHAQGDLAQWAVYDFKFSMPAYYTLDKFSLRSGYLEFNFLGPGAELKLRRWGLAGMLLKGMALEKWAAGVAPKTLKREFSKIVKKEEPLHEIVELALKRWSWFAFYARRCTEVNKIYALEYNGRKEEALFSRIAAKIQCH